MDSRKPIQLPLLIAALGFCNLAHAAEIIAINSFDPNTFFSAGITAGIDFDVDSDGAAGFQAATQPGFLSVPATGAKDYNVTHNGITFDIKTINANQANQARWRGAATAITAGTLINDFQQWYGRNAGGPVEAAVTLSGLTANTDYQISFFTYNVGAGQSTHGFHEGTSSADPLITTFITAGNQNNHSAWKPGITFQINSGASGEIAVTIVAPTFDAGNGNVDSRLTLNGISVVEVAPPADPLRITSIDYGTGVDEVTITFTGAPSTAYTCKSSIDLTDFSTTETPINGTDFLTDGSGNGSFVVAASGTRRFYRMESLP